MRLTFHINFIQLVNVKFSEAQVSEHNSKPIVAKICIKEIKIALQTMCPH